MLSRGFGINLRGEGLKCDLLWDALARLDRELSRRGEYNRNKKARIELCKISIEGIRLHDDQLTRDPSCVWVRVQVVLVQTL